MSVPATIPYTIVYPHPDHFVYGLVDVSTAAVSTQRMAYFLDQVAKQHSVIPTKPTPTLYRPSGLHLEPEDTLFERTRQWLREHHENKGGQISLISKVITKVLPQDRDLHELDVIVVTPEIIESLNEVDGHMRAYGKAMGDREPGVPSSTSSDVEGASDRAHKVYELLWRTKRPITKQQGDVRYLDPEFSISNTCPIMIRDEYDDLWKEILSRMEKHAIGSVHGMVITGQPGIGKSFFLEYAYALALQCGIPTVFCDVPAYFSIADDDGFRDVPFTNPRVYLRSDTLVLVDSIKPPEQLTMWRHNRGFMVQATPQEERWKEWRKQRGGVGWVMTTWTREEVSSLQKLHESLNLAPWTQNPWFTPLELYDLLGPSVRSCFWSEYQCLKPQTGTSISADLLHGPLGQDLGDLNLFADADKFLDALDTGSMMPLVQWSSFHSFFFATHRLNPVRVMPIPFLKSEVPSQFLRLCLAMHYRQHAKAKGLKLFATMAPLAQVTWRLFEPLVLNLLVETEKGLQCTLCDNTTFRLGPDLAVHPHVVDPSSFTPGIATAFSPVNNRIYVVPEHYPFVDAFAVTEDMKRVTLLHMTVGQNLKSQGVQGVIEMFGDAAAGIRWSVVFVTPGVHGETIARLSHPLQVARQQSRWAHYEVPVGWLPIDSTIGADVE